jgi:hypothetical protein
MSDKITVDLTSDDEFRLLKSQTTNPTPPIRSTSGVNPICESGGNSLNVINMKPCQPIMWEETHENVL